MHPFLFVSILNISLFFIPLAEISEEAKGTEETAVAKSLSFPTSQNPWQEKIPSSLSENFSTGLQRLNQPDENLSATSLPSNDSFLSSLPSNLPNNSFSSSHHSNLPTNSFSTGHHSNLPKNSFLTGNPSNQHKNSILSNHSSNGPYPNFMFPGANNTAGYSALSQVPYIASNAAPFLQKEPDRTIPLRGSKSYSDISSLSDVEIMNSERGRSRTPPSYCPVTKPVVSVVLLTLHWTVCHIWYI